MFNTNLLRKYDNGMVAPIKRNCYTSVVVVKSIAKTGKKQTESGGNDHNLENIEQRHLPIIYLRPCSEIHHRDWSAKNSLQKTFPLANHVVELDNPTLLSIKRFIAKQTLVWCKSKGLDW